MSGFGAMGGRNFHIPNPITLATGFYNSLHYCASHDSDNISETVQDRDDVKYRSLTGSDTWPAAAAVDKTAEHLVYRASKCYPSERATLGKH